MALMTCGECGEQVSSQAKACPHCGAKPGGRATSVLLIACLSILAIVVISNMDPEQPAPSRSTADQIPAGVRAAAEYFVTNQLKSPSTATFAPREEWRITPLGSNRYRATAWVESHNSFGAMLRKTFTTVVELKGGDWQPASVTIDE